MNDRIKSQRWIILLALLLSIVLAYWVIGQGKTDLYEENQLMENIQLFILGLCAFVFWRTDWSPAEVSERPQLRMAMTAATALCLSFFLREMSVKSIGADWLVFWVDGNGFKILMLPLWFYLISRLARHRHYYLAISRNLLKTPTAFMLLVSATLLIGGGLFDKGILNPVYYRFYEEILEINGYVLLLLAAMNSHQDLARAARSHSARNASQGVTPNAE